MEKLSINACPVCGGAHLKRVMTCTDFYASGEQFELYSCEDCGFTFTQGVPVEAEIGKYYETPDYISHTDTRKGAMNNIYHYVRSYMLGRKARLVAKEAHRKTGRLLDIGTGTGYFSDTMVRRGWKVEAVEKSPQAREFAKLHFDLDVKPESALKEFAPGSFDVITLWHVMEHLEHLDEVWQRLHELLTEKGVLIVAVPNCSSYDAQRYGEYWAAYDVPRHLWHFTPGTIQQLASRHGFIMAARHPMPFDAFYVSMLSEKHRGSSCSFLKGMFAGTLAWFNALGRKERSSSMIYVFRKKRYRMGNQNKYKSGSIFDMQFITSSISTTLVLLLLGLVVFFVLTAHNLSVYVRENISFSVLISDDMKEADILKLQKKLNQEPFVKQSEYISKKQALKEQTEAMGTDPEEFLGYNPFTASIEIKLHSDYANSDSIAKIEKMIKKNTNIQDVLYRKELIDAVNDNIRNISLVLLALAVVLTFISFALINNTIRLAIYSKRFLIHTMKLVGASWGFIRGPFLRKNVWSGILAAIVADSVLMGTAYWAVTYEQELLQVITPEVMLIVCASVLVFGIVITWLCAYFSMNKYLRMKANSLYYI